MGLEQHEGFVFFLKASSEYYQAFKNYQRIGQAYYNMLRIWKPELEKEIENTTFDCFGDDSRLPAFLVWVQARLDRLDAEL